MKKILFFDLPFHERTGSSRFFTNLLSTWGSIRQASAEGLIDAGAEGSIGIAGNESFDAAIFFQVLPPFHKMLGLHCDNLVWVPMWDGIDSDIFERLARPPLGKLVLARLKVLCFSATVYREASRCGLNCLHVQYLPPLPDHWTGARSGISCYFWQRRDQPNWHTVKALLGDTRVDQMQLKLVPDPDVEASMPCDADQSQYHIELHTEWTSQESYLNQLSQCTVYFSPRIREGIGMAMLEAMARGLCVVNADAATGNEYIIHEHNGLLYDPSHPAPLDFSLVEQLGQRARETVRDGHRHWLECEPAMFEFLFSATPPRESQTPSTP